MPDSTTESPVSLIKLTKSQKKRARRKRAAARKVEETKKKQNTPKEVYQSSDMERLAQDLAALCTKSKRSSDRNTCLNNTSDIDALAESEFIEEIDAAEREETTKPVLQNESLVAKLELLHSLAQKNDISKFVNEFVPLDIEEEDISYYQNKLESGEVVGRNGESEWDFLKAEIEAMHKGNIRFIDGDYEGSEVITFTFEHPLETKCDREVTFSREGSEWRADG